VAFAFYIVLSLPGHAQFEIKGTVYSNDKRPLAGVFVFLHELQLSAITNPDGTYHFKHIAPGHYHIHYAMDGYMPEVVDVTISNQDLKLEVELMTDINKLPEIVLKADLFKIQEEESSLLIKEVDQVFINRHAGSTLANTLDQLEGISVINQGVGVSKPVIRGLSFNRITVVEQGIKQEGQQWGADHGLEIDQYAVEKLDILKGPASLVFGSDAMGGVINIRNNMDLLPGQKEFTIKPIYQSVNQSRGLTGAFKSGVGSLVYKVQGTFTNYNDYTIPADSFTYLGFRMPIENGKLKNTAGKERHINSTIGVVKNWGHSHLTVSNYNQRVGVFPGATGFARGYSIKQDQANNIELPSQSINHFKVLSNSLIKKGSDRLEVDLGFQQNSRKEFESPVSHGFPVDLKDSLGIEMQLSTWSINARLKHNLADNWECWIGTQSDYKQNNVSGFDFIIPSYQQVQSGLFLINQWKLSEKYILNAGIRSDYANQKASQVNQPFYHQFQVLDTIERSPEISKNYLNASGSLGLSYIPNSTFNFKANVGKTFRLPSMAELTSNGAHHGTFRFEKGDENLNSENGYQLDLGVVVEKRRIHFTLTPFVNYFSNFIYLSPSNRFASATIDGTVYPYAVGGQLYQYKQNRALYYGGEFALHYHHKSNIVLGINGDLVINKNLDTGLPLPFTPAPSLNPSIFYELDSLKSIHEFYIGFTAKIAAAQNRVDRNERTTPDSQIVDFSMGWAMGKKHTVLFNFQIQNIFNTTYYNHLSRYRILNLPEPGRNFVVALAYQWH